MDGDNASTQNKNESINEEQVNKLEQSIHRFSRLTEITPTENMLCSDIKDFKTKLMEAVKTLIPLLKKDINLDINPLPVENKCIYISDLYNCLSSITLLINANHKLVEDPYSVQLSSDLIIFIQRANHILGIMLLSLKNKTVTEQQAESYSDTVREVRNILKNFLQYLGNLTQMYPTNNL